ncbi:MAG: 16S rRNA (cytidine(1402)-2'-O)-methyltransferase [Pseudomonadota bacterium]
MTTPLPKDMHSVLASLWARAQGDHRTDDTLIAPGLYVVATPIGHLADITVRALTVLRSVEAIICEDTRRTRILLHAYGLRKRLLSHHAHNQARTTDSLLARLRDGQALALVSDAGMPTISDPGTHLIAAAQEAGVRVHCVPGASAVTAAAAVSGLTVDRFVFAGFIPSARTARRAWLRALSQEATIALEAPHRLADCLADMVELMPARRLAVTRELTKVFEEVAVGPAGALIDRFPKPKGEVTLVIEAAAAQAVITQEALDGAIHKMRVAQPGGSVRDIAARVAQELAIPRRRAYQRVLALSCEGRGAQSETKKDAE